ELERITRGLTPLGDTSTLVEDVEVVPRVRLPSHVRSRVVGREEFRAPLTERTRRGAVGGGGRWIGDKASHALVFRRIPYLPDAVGECVADDASVPMSRVLCADSVDAAWNH